ncbi:MBOAT family O-acyltransferase [Myxococcaceae bacterium GXIMD 01537]
MPFHSLPFLAFLCVTFAVYWAVAQHRRLRLTVLLFASLVFYGALTPFPFAVFFTGATVDTLLLRGVAAALAHHPLLIFLVGVTVDHLLVKGMGRSQNPRTRKLLVTLSVVFNLSLLATFKYVEMLRETALSLLAPLGISVRSEPFGLLLPVGLSFYCFQAISYTVDVYRGKASSKYSFFEHLLYMLFFPRVVSGPIVRASELLESFRQEPSLTREAGGQALYRIAVGLVKKLVIADVLGSGLVDPIFRDPEAYTSAECMVAAVAYTFELYYDFSGYSDIAIGVAGLFGFKFPENFARPYLATNLSDFWNRWHQSLSTWLRDYLYRPLGGSRVSKPRILFNLMMVMVLGGLWHGADWRFAVWGAVHGVALGIVRIYWWMIGGKPEDPGLARKGLGLVATFTLVVLTRVVFRAPDMGHAKLMFERIALGLPGLDNVSLLLWGMLAVAVLCHALPRRLDALAASLFIRMPAPAQAVVLVAIGLGVRHMSSVEARPYVYLQF